MPREGRWRHQSVAHVASLCQPAVRMVVVRVFAFDDDAGNLTTDVQFDPVLAVAAIQWRNFAKHDGPGSYSTLSSVSERTNRQEGWEPSDVNFTADVMFADPENGPSFYYHDHDGWGCSNERHKVVACPWPPEEDGERLRGVVEMLRKDVLENERLKRAEKASGDGDPEPEPAEARQ
jgi:hypothetical protein